MFFYVFIDPETVRDANESGPDRLNLLARFLKDHLHDCLFAETDLWRVGERIKDHVQQITFHVERKLITELLVELRKKRPGVIIEGDAYDADLFTLATRSGDQYELDFILSPRAEAIINGQLWECANLPLVSQTDFERKCFRYRPDIQIKAGVVTSSDFWNCYLVKLVRPSEHITIVDYSLGQFLGEGHYTNLRKWVRWLGETVANPRSCKVFLVTYDGNGRNFTTDSLKKLLEEFRQEVDL